MMFQAVLVLATICNVVAFAPSSAMRNTRSMQMSSTEKMVGASIEVNGGVYPDILAKNFLLRPEFDRSMPLLTVNVCLHSTLQARFMTHWAC